VITASGRRELERLRIVAINGNLIKRDPTADQHLLPWDGRSPRGLTESNKRIRLGHEGASLNEFDARIDEQCRRHFNGS